MIIMNLIALLLIIICCNMITISLITKIRSDIILQPKEILNQLGIYPTIFGILIWLTANGIVEIMNYLNTHNI